MQEMAAVFQAAARLQFTAKPAIMWSLIGKETYPLYNIAICDDDQAFAVSFRAQLTRALDGRAVPHQITVYSDPDALQRAVEDGSRYELLFLDVIFAEAERGIRLAAALKAAGCGADVVFMSSTPDFAAASFDVAPLHYLLKPVSEEKLNTALDRFLDKNAPCLFHFVTTRRHLQLPLTDIVYFEIFLRDIVIHRANGEKETCVGTLKDVEDRLPAHTFVRPHRSYLVNIDHISEIVRYEIRVSTGETVPVSRKLYAQVQQAIIDRAEQRVTRS